MIAVELNAGHDRNGNPRRLYVVLDKDGAVIDTIDAGYRKVGALREFYPTIPVGPTFDSSVSEYRRLKKWGEQKASRVARS